jgi:hypothetical protein
VFGLGDVNTGSMGGAPDFVQRALGSLGGGNRTSQNTTVSNASAVNVNPTFVQSSGGSPSVAPYVGPSTASPSASGSSSAAGQDPSGMFGRTGVAYRTTPQGAAFYDPLNTAGGGVGGNGDLLLPLLLGAGLLFFALQDG